MNYVAHVCSKCECMFISEDYTNAQNRPPAWRYCEKCAKELGIDYAKQRPWTNYSKAKKERLENLKKAGKYYQFKSVKTLKNTGNNFNAKVG